MKERAQMLLQKARQENELRAQQEAQSPSTDMPSPGEDKTVEDVRQKAQEFNYLPNDKILDWSKSKAFVDNKINVG